MGFFPLAENLIHPSGVDIRRPFLKADCRLVAFVRAEGGEKKQRYLGLPLPKLSSGHRMHAPLGIEGAEEVLDSPECMAKAGLGHPPLAFGLSVIGPSLGQCCLGLLLLAPD